MDGYWRTTFIRFTPNDNLNLIEHADKRSICDDKHVITGDAVTMLGVIT